MEFNLTEQELIELSSKLSDVGITISSDSYIMVGIISLISSGCGGYIGWYLKEKGQDKAITEGFREVKERLYELLIKLEDNATTYSITSNFGDSPNKAFQKAKSTTEEFIAYSKLSKLWGPKTLYLETEELPQLLDKHVYSVLLKVSSKNAENNGIEQGIQASTEAVSILQNNVPKAKEKIVKSIRGLLDPTYS